MFTVLWIYWNSVKPESGIHSSVLTIDPSFTNHWKILSIVSLDFALDFKKQFSYPDFFPHKNSPVPLHFCFTVAFSRATVFLSISTTIPVPTVFRLIPGTMLPSGWHKNHVPNHCIIFKPFSNPQRLFQQIPFKKNAFL